MCKNRHNSETVHYCTILSATQWDFLLEGKYTTFRQKCLHRLMTDAVRTRTICKIKGIDITLEVGQVAASDVELAAYLECNRKTVSKLIDSFNRLGMLTTKTNNRTSVHTLHFLTGWYVDGVLLTNPHYVRPSATTKGQTGDIRTPATDTSFSFGRQCNDHRHEQEADSTECDTFPLSSSLCSSDTPDLPPPDFFDEEETDNPHIMDYGNRPFDSIPLESHKQAQNGTDDGKAIPT